MALFGRKNKKENEKGEDPKTEVKIETNVEAKAITTKNRKNILNSSVKFIIQPRITEKATLLADSKNVYVFEITADANKNRVKQAIQDIYNVTPIKVSIVKNPSTKMFSRGIYGVTPGVKKAYVYLKKGEKIEII